MAVQSGTQVGKSLAVGVVAVSKDIEIFVSAHDVDSDIRVHIYKWEIVVWFQVSMLAI